MTPSLDRLRTLLFLVPYVVRHRGVPLQELAQRLAMSEDDLLSEIDFLLMIGRPPFQPSDYLDIYEQNGKVYVDLHQSLKEPPRFTVIEALALACAAQLFTGIEMGEAAMAVQKAIEKVIQTLPPDAQRLFADISSHYLMLSGGSPGPQLEIIRRAIEEHREIDLQNFSANRAEVVERTVQPYGLGHRKGVWYLVAFCTKREGIRVFRLTRIREVFLTDRIFDPPKDFDLEKWLDQSLSIPSQGQQEVVIHFSTDVSRWVKERWGSEYLTPQQDGSLIARIHDVSDEFVLSYVASFAGEARILSPPRLTQLLKEEAQKVLLG